MTGCCFYEVGLLHAARHYSASLLLDSALKDCREGFAGYDCVASVFTDVNQNLRAAHLLLALF